MFTIYRIKNKINNNSYIGFTTKVPPEKRWREHELDAKRGSSFYFHRAIRKYGKDNFSFEILSQGIDHKFGLEHTEPLLIENYKPEYNSSVGGRGRVGVSLSNEHKDKIRNKLCGIKRGPHSDNHKKKIGAGVRGIPLSSAHKKAISISRTGQRLSIEHQQKISAAKSGIPLSLEHRQKISDSMKRFKAHAANS
jgi:group I intron endonuclease